MKTILTAFTLCVASLAIAGGPKPVTDLQAALDKAKSENKMLFVQMGREACGNCQALKSMIESSQLRLSDSKFVYADVNCDDPATHRLFSTKFSVKGSTLPFVAIASADGTMLAGRTGYGSPKEFEDLIREAGKQAKKHLISEKK